MKLILQSLDIILYIILFILYIIYTARTPEAVNNEVHCSTGIQLGRRVLIVQHYNK